MSIEKIRQFIRKKAEEFGAKTNADFNKPYIERNNTGHEALQDNGAYFGFIHPEEETSGPFHDFSLTIFPSSDHEPWLICLGIGSLGFRNDYELATYPGLRRLFSRLVNERGYCKSDFSDIETSLPKSITGNEDLTHLKNTIRTYSKVLPACQIVNDPESEVGERIIAAFVAGYAKLRDWPTNSTHRKAISDALSPFMNTQNMDDEKNVIELLRDRRYVILQGPPGTGKTRLAKTIAEKMKGRIFFTQFHAETTYSDFIYGIRPNINRDELSYMESLGAFTRALRHSIDTNEATILIIDEINRANLSNVLGPAFYLFEYNQDISDVSLEITPELSVNKLPNNFYVIATMNTADRSLAVVDFALRRRFAWYSLKPQSITRNDFYEDDFFAIQEIFDWFADSNELSLQPGQGYFIASSDEDMNNRIKYEIYPLIREYLQEGLLRRAKEEFNNYFQRRINFSLFE